MVIDGESRALVQFVDLEILSSATILLEGRLVDASNATLFGSISISADTNIAIVYKPIAGERPLWDFSEGSLAFREVAAFHISELAGFRCVPPTVLRDGPYGTGAVQQWVDIDDSIDVISLGRSKQPEIRSLALFDAVINNTDRKFGHILPASITEIYGCDHGVSFHAEDKLRTVIWQFAGEQLTLEEQKQLTELKNEIPSHSSIIKLLTEEEISALLMRIQRLLSQNHFPFPSEEWPAVPWPPV